MPSSLAVTAVGLLLKHGSSPAMSMPCGVTAIWLAFTSSNLLQGWCPHGATTYWPALVSPNARCLCFCATNQGVCNQLLAKHEMSTRLRVPLLRALANLCLCFSLYGQTHVGLAVILAKEPFAFVRALLWQDAIPSNRSTGRVAGALISYAAALRISTLKSLATG